MNLAIDHLVLAVDDPATAADTLEATLGLRAVEGGRHDALGTFNRLVWLGDTYLELIGVFDPSLAAESWIGRPVLRALERGGGLATWAVAVDDLQRHLGWLADDVDVSTAVDGQRRRPDGRVVRWRLAHPAQPSATRPFLIEHDPWGAEWTAGERRVRGVETHPVGGRVRLAALEVLDAAPAAAAAFLRKLLATTVEPAGRRAVRARLGDQVVRFAVPDGEGVGAVAELLTDAPIPRRRTARIGDCELRLRAAPRTTTARAEGPAADPGEGV